MAVFCVKKKAKGDTLLSGIYWYKEPLSGLSFKHFELSDINFESSLTSQDLLTRENSILTEYHLL
jgi:hypothetical protein